ncbi:hypothetical protein ARMGADRAFT_1083317 [Armillaria gallica]|uniref:Uncharacterized protein n=1 Tax=Armillaria gallica TaxID=47427 RepID=A0A2H3D3K0_ARMGA|nr:hypothetical protein ARMGADRAFT_1083317 [Armillaria gallica]
MSPSPATTTTSSIPIPAPYCTHHCLYDHCQTSTSTFNIRESDGNLHFYWGMRKRVGEDEREGRMGFRFSMTNEAGDKCTLSTINGCMEGASNAPTIIAVRPPQHLPLSTSSSPDIRVSHVTQTSCIPQIVHLRMLGCETPTLVITSTIMLPSMMAGIFFVFVSY